MLTSESRKSARREGTWFLLLPVLVVTPAPVEAAEEPAADAAAAGAPGTGIGADTALLLALPSLRGAAPAAAPVPAEAPAPAAEPAEVDPPPVEPDAVREW